jgi:ribosomal-protein-serine acetyltransferase
MALHTIPTSRPELELRELSVGDADAYFSLVDGNRDHLGQHGDYAELNTATAESIHAELAAEYTAGVRFGAWCGDTIVGRFDLTDHHDGNYVLGYWLGRQYLGRGYATAACWALMAYARDELTATNVWAGVTKGNDASEAVLERLGFAKVQDMGTYTRFHKSIIDASDQP